MRLQRGTWVVWVLACAGGCTLPAHDDGAADDASLGSSSDAGTSSSDDRASSSGDAETPSGDSFDTPAPTLGPRCDVPIGNGPALVLHGQTRDVGDDIMPPLACGSDVDGEDVVFAWTAPVAGRYRVRSGALDDAPLLAVWADCSDGPLLACLPPDEDGNAAVELVLAAGQQIAVLVDDGVPSGETEYVLQIGELPPDPPSD